MDFTGAEWRTSSRSSGNGQCVEVADNLPGIVAVRDSKDRQGATLAFPSTSWASFIKQAKAGEFDL
ncbi:DUF397 domain-containing protein [Actinoplanes sp. N902-109]|uniref:DUF397 domain-containing protein n=1 Tax=Actinoplanes sp. (strain N902-109) TaxID=649831 RepID=UPI0003295B33|nr:DUF397 domain-containing protein [Actinoplanes sp. N902-109]AGL19481.1 hypothetical protein L083_5971 [Actinoplanes sp. N902-109]